MPTKIVVIRQDTFDSVVSCLKNALAVSSKIHKDDRTFRTSDIERDIKDALSYLEKEDTN